MGPCAQHPEDAVHDRAVVVAGTTRLPALVGQEQADAIELGLGQIKAAHSGALAYLRT